MGNEPNERVIVNDRWVGADNHCPISMKLSPVSVCSCKPVCACPGLQRPEGEWKTTQGFCFGLTSSLSYQR